MTVNGSPVRFITGCSTGLGRAPARLDSLRTAFDTWREVTLGADYPVTAS
ncbi:hypothetical protein [Streptomyces malaysiensis]|nr:hypothetical protein R8789_42555 [Streptomyces malaysiensis]